MIKSMIYPLKFISSSLRNLFGANQTKLPSMSTNSSKFKGWDGDATKYPKVNSSITCTGFSTKTKRHKKSNS